MLKKSLLLFLALSTQAHALPSIANRSFFSQITSTPVCSAVATGGVVTTVGDYKTLDVTSDVTLTVSSLSCSFEYVAVGGGAGGGTGTVSNFAGGGAGAGRVRKSSVSGPLVLPLGAYPISIGLGGPANTNGGDTTLSTLTAEGGGKGCTSALNSGNGANGGSGGGSCLANGGASVGIPGTGISPGGNSGGQANTSNGAAAGGGGCGGVGGNPANPQPGAGVGGPGCMDSLRTGSPEEYGCGGGAGAYAGQGGINAPGGCTGAGTGGLSGPGNAATDGFGHGGGGGAADGAAGAFNGAAGGKGRMVLKWKFQ